MSNYVNSANKNLNMTQRKNLKVHIFFCPLPLLPSLYPLYLLYPPLPSLPSPLFFLFSLSPSFPPFLFSSIISPTRIGTCNLGIFFITVPFLPSILPFPFSQVFLSSRFSSIIFFCLTVLELFHLRFCARRTKKKTTHIWT